MENVVWTQYLPGFVHVGTLRKATFWDYFGVPKWGANTRPQENSSEQALGGLGELLEGLSFLRAPGRGQQERE